jgi:undecaprenyl diphosphate synthase
MQNASLGFPTAGPHPEIGQAIPLSSLCILHFAFCILHLPLPFLIFPAAEEQPLPETSLFKPDTLERLAAARLEPDRMPRHVAIIMDGNGRWANQRGLPRIEGHRRGVQSVRATVEEGCRLGLEQLTLYCLSIENWKRPQAELDFLMTLLRKYLIEERAEIMEQNIRFTTIGRREGLPAKVLREMEENIRVSQHNTGMVLCLAINYGGRTELVDAVRTVARQVQEGKLDPEAIDEDTVSGALYTAGMPDPDLLIRTAGEMRVSNYLLWQISYAELWVTERCWPDFDRATFHAALRDFSRRERRFGGLKG